jgi:hypothetical protein
LLHLAQSQHFSFEPSGPRDTIVRGQICGHRQLPLKHWLLVWIPLIPSTNLEQSSGFISLTENPPRAFHRLSHNQPIARPLCSSCQQQFRAWMRSLLSGSRSRICKTMRASKWSGRREPQTLSCRLRWLSSPTATPSHFVASHLCTICRC